ncbi:hypothetical protein wTpre_1235 [Wolbachia endosymbiont of Trichogramma pretiosum]|nr:hypothetical protein wTpre_1235 [Wolbachia endosymbiont of Trichogramma pretiosum]
MSAAMSSLYDSKTGFYVSYKCLRNYIYSDLCEASASSLVIRAGIKVDKSTLQRFVYKSQCCMKLFVLVPFLFILFCHSAEQIVCANKLSTEFLLLSSHRSKTSFESKIPLIL